MLKRQLRKGMCQGSCLSTVMKDFHLYSPSASTELNKRNPNQRQLMILQNMTEKEDVLH